MSDRDETHAIDHNGGFVAALRSVWFYYIACTPCRKIGHRRENRKEAERERGLKARLEMEQPGLYRHPNPEDTNQYWMEDISMGPSLSRRGVPSRDPSRAKASTTAAAPGTATTERGNSVGSSGTIPSRNMAANPSDIADDLELRTTLSMSATDSTDLQWNRKRYQREDEELWGHQIYNRAGQRLREVITKGRDTAGRLFDTRTGRERDVTEEERHHFYAAPRNPPVNDYHPPVVSSSPVQRDEFRWMLQPPPPAKVMEGKVPPVSRTGSQTSVGGRTQASHASKEELGLGRTLGEKLVKDKIRKGERPSDAELTAITASRPNTRRTRTGSTMSSIPSQWSSRSRSNTTGSESSDTIYDRRRKRRTAAKKQKAAAAGPGSEADDESDAEDDRVGRVERHASQRPKLQTIASADLCSNKAETCGDLHPPITATMAESAPWPSPEPASRGGGTLGDITNSATSAATMRMPPAEKRAASTSVDSGIALAQGA